MVPVRIYRRVRIAPTDHEIHHLHMSGCVYRLHSTLELPLETVHEHFEDADYPEEIADVEITRRNNTLILRAVAASDDIGKYTPTAQLKASVTERRVYEDPPPEQEAATPGGPNPRWVDPEEEEERESKLIEVAAFKGDRETVLQNTALQYPMFEVLCDVARLSEKGTLTAIASTNDELEAVRIVEGEDRPATVEVVETPSTDGDATPGVDWRNNEFIS